MSDGKPKVPLFDGKINYHDWKYRMETHLDQDDDMLDFVEKGYKELAKKFEIGPDDNANTRKRKEESLAELLKKDKKCKNIIVERIGDEVLEIVKGKKYAFEVWEVLSERFSKTQVSSRIVKSKQFHQLKYRPKEETFLEYCVKFDKLVRELKLCGSNLDDIDITLQFLWSLPKDFDAVVNSLQALDHTQLTLEMVRARIEEFVLIRSDKKMNVLSDDTPKTTNVAFSARGGARRTYFPNINCNNCGKLGHKKIDCYLEGGGAYCGRGRGGSSSRGRGRGTWNQGGRGQNYRGRGGRGFRGGRGDYQGGRGGANQNNNKQQPNVHQANAAGSPPPNKKTKKESASLAEVDQQIVYSFMCTEVNEIITVKSPIYSENLLFGQVQEGSAVMFILDSGASRHLVKTDVPVQNKKRVMEPIIIQVAKSNINLKAFFKGSVECESEVNGQIRKLHIEVLIVEDLSHNLISISSLEKQGYKITFWNGKCYIKFEKDLIALGSRENNLYPIYLNVNSSEFSMFISNEHQFDVWHRRLGHIGSQRLLQLCKIVDGIGELKCINNSVCDICVQGKHAKTPFGGSRIRATRPLERIHTDLCGPIAPTGLRGVKYILTFIDDYSHFTVMFGLVRKTEVYQFFREFEARVTNRFSLKICFLRCDNGTEFVNNAMKQLCAEKGIKYELTIPGTPELNGVAERMNRTCLEKARCLLLDSSLSKRFWIEATMTAIYLINRCPTRAIDENKVPAELWYGVSQDLSKLRVFGCVVFVKKPKEQLKGKFDSRSKKCIMLGYSDNGYRVWSIEEQKIIVARDVVFDETRNKFHSNDSVYDESGFAEDEEESDEPIVMDFNEEQQQECGEGSSEGLQNVVDSGVEFPQIEVFEEPNCEAGTSTSPCELRRSTRVKLKPVYLKDYATLAAVAKFVDEVALESDNDDSALICKSEGEKGSPVVERDLFLDAPTSFQDLMGRPDKHKWIEAIKEEIQALVDNGTWVLVPMPEHKQPINCMWIFTLKFGADGNLDRYKARLVVKGCAQKKGIDYNETYAPVARLVTLRVFLCLVNKENLLTNQLDVKNAFLNGDLRE